MNLFSSEMGDHLKIADTVNNQSKTLLIVADFHSSY